MNGAPRVVNGLLTLLLSAGVSLGCAQAPTVATAAAATFDPARVAKGAQLSAIGNCRVCHTAEGGASFAGGRALPTPFGTIFATNITPDAGTGIGRWTEADFRRALHEGVDRAGHQLYPAFPYDHFTLVSDDDVGALYAFIMTREPVAARAPANRLVFPANIRPLLRVWKWLYFDPGRFVADAQQSAEWNRGAYLVEGLAHCGACHTPRNFAGAEKRGDRLEGGDAENWHAPALLAASPAPVPWTADALFGYLRHGFDARHGLAAGPMASVVDSFANIPESDVHAIVAYLTSLRGQRRNAAVPEIVASANAREFDAVGRHAPDRASEEHAMRAAGPPQGSNSAPAGGSAAAKPQAWAEQLPATDAGEIIFAGACATCHYAGDALPARKPVPLALATSINAKDPRDALRVVVDGVHPESGEAGAIMPGFGGALTDEQIAAVVDYARARFSAAPRWINVADTLRKIRREDAK
jgi:mono/diheme cytochrome c family protein